MSTTAARYVSRFGAGVDDGGKGDKNFLGGKGTNVDGMPAIGLPVPPGFTITTEVCTFYYNHGRKYPPQLKTEVNAALRRAEPEGGGEGGCSRPLALWRIQGSLRGGLLRASQRSRRQAALVRHHLRRDER